MAGGFPLRKWASNSKELLDSISPSNLSSAGTWSPAATQHNVLGVQWLPRFDCFQVTVSTDAFSTSFTKRAVLSKTPQIFDPLGWLSPTTVWAKMFIQTLWLMKSDWDTSLPPHERQQWTKFVDQLPALNSIRIPRWIGLLPSSCLVELHGFVDASERAYAAVIYLRVIDSNGHSRSTLVTAKTKVSPVKKISIPRLELCAACLVTRLAARMIPLLGAPEAKIHLWTDSLVALGWIRGHPSRWKTFVANRVSEVQQLLPQAVWHHVGTQDNPADCASRGLMPSELPAFSLWWAGPSWLNTPESWPHLETSLNPTGEEERIHSLHTQVPTEDEVSSLIKQFSNLQRMFRVIAWCRRWRSRTGTNHQAYLSSSEIQSARAILLQVIQEHHFPKERACLRSQQPLPARSRLVKLAPFLDGDGFLRLGGRLRNAELPVDRKHPPILPDDSHVATLWVRDAHHRCLHGGVQLTLAMLRQECWILRGRQMVKACIHRCVTCVRWRAQTAGQLMGNLPRSRLIPCRPFYRVGIDYAGPILIRSGRGRGQQCVKGYIALFVCLTTKAVHLEVVSDGTSETFIAALKRFISRRGLCAQIFNDCGTAFVGADRELRSLLCASDPGNHNLFHTIAAQGIEWKFNPPAAPHFGGLWEAAVKSVKHHLRRQIGEQKLTYEELITLLTGIEACLNSRPLELLTHDPEDLQPLTPGHFLIGEPLLAIPEPTLVDLPASRLSRWQLIQQLQQHFWRRWSGEYLNTLQPRHKWSRVQPAIQAGTLCLLKNELLPPTQWPLARVVEVHPGSDGLTRVVTVQTAASKFRRPIAKIVPLPSEAGISDAGRTTQGNECTSK